MEEQVKQRIAKYLRDVQKEVSRGGDLEGKAWELNSKIGSLALALEGHVNGQMLAKELGITN